MKKPRLSIRTFLILCLLLGAVGVPWGWRTYQARQQRLAAQKAAEIERLEKKLGELWENEPPAAMGSTFYLPNGEWAKRIDQLADRLEKLTGVRPERPLPKYEIPYDPTPVSAVWMARNVRHIRGPGPSSSDSAPIKSKDPARRP